MLVIVFFFNDTATAEIYPLSLHDALPICDGVESRRPDGGADGWLHGDPATADARPGVSRQAAGQGGAGQWGLQRGRRARPELHTDGLPGRPHLGRRPARASARPPRPGPALAPPA